MAASRRRRMFLVCKIGSKFFLQLIVAVIGWTAFVNADLNIADVNNCATHIGYQLYEMAKFVTYTDQIKKSFESSGARVKNKNGTQMVMEMSGDIQKMMAWKIQAIQRITDTAEEARMGYQYEENLEYAYNNAKLINKKGQIQVPLTRDKHFYNMPVSTKDSSVHVPTNVYDKASEVLNAIKWSENINPIFQSNYHLDPSLSWQYFGSSTGFLRQYPAIEWTSETLDTFDCRMRPWYIEAATHPKDMVILLDVSGSMTGKRKEIAKHVVLNILDTLNDDDYFTISNFSDVIKELVPCFRESLVPANMENIREYKKALQDMDTENIANFSLALTSAFDILRTYNETKEGSLCNQAIMLITDGAPRMYEAIFQTYNWPNRYVRVFTYLIGQEMSDVKEVEWMACSNRGFYSHVSTIAEARDQVQKYVPVMARPLVLHQSHNVIWTSVYADIADPKLSDWMWEQQRRKKQKEMFQHYQMEPDYRVRDFNDYPADEPVVDEAVSARPENVTSDSHDHSEDEIPFYRLMTTVAYPVFDRSNKTKRLGHLLGVAGTDVPIEEITKLATPYKLGVNGYAFAITNNGYILFHPDLRPLEDNKLKPDYNSVDLTEVELRYTDLPPREYDEDLLRLRRNMVDGQLDHTKLQVKIHLDDLKRIVTRHQNYFYSSLKDTPFSFAIVLPEGYGMHEIIGQFNLNNYRSNNITLEYRRKVLSLFEGDKWVIHPDWIYCRHLYSNPDRPNRTREENLVHFLHQIPFRNLSWGNHPRVKPLPKGEDYSYDKASKINRDEVYCDHELIQSLIFDANATKNHEKQVGNIEKRTSAAQKYGVTISFVATRTGLTRWEEFEPESKNFARLNSRAIDELWYKRAVDYHLVDNKSFVFSVPFNASGKNDSLVTATYAIFVGGGPGYGMHRKAPVAVVGLQFRHWYLRKFLDGIPSCSVPCMCKMNCSSDDVDCYLLDNNGFVISDEKSEQVGKFYGEVERNIMEALVKDSTFKRIHMVDYQAVCFDKTLPDGAANILLTPFTQLKYALTWLWYKVVFFFVNYSFGSWWCDATNGYQSSRDFAERTTNCESDSLQYTNIIPKHQARPCDKEFYLYELNLKRFAETSPRSGRLQSCGGPDCTKSYAVQLVPHTNLVLLVVEDPCKCETSKITLDHIEIIYNETQMCQWLKSNIYRRRPPQCVNYHPLELNITDCGSGVTYLPSKIVVIFMVVTSSFIKYFYTA